MIEEHFCHNPKCRYYNYFGTGEVKTYIEESTFNVGAEHRRIERHKFIWGHQTLFFCEVCMSAIKISQRGIEL